jgi:hypothetical protein
MQSFHENIILHINCAYVHITCILSRCFNIHKIDYAFLNDSFDILQLIKSLEKIQSFNIPKMINVANLGTDSQQDVCV